MTRCVNLKTGSSKSGQNYIILTDATYGLEALEGLVDDLETRLSAARAGYLDHLPNYELITKFPSAEVQDAIAVATETDTTEKTITVALPTGASLVRVMLAAFIIAMNNSATAQKVDIDVKGRKGSGAWSTFFSQDDVIGMGAVDGATAAIVGLQDISSLVDAAASYGFKCSITQSSANSVKYTTQYLVIITWKMS